MKYISIVILSFLLFSSHMKAQKQQKTKMNVTIHYYDGSKKSGTVKMPIFKFGWHFKAVDKDDFVKLDDDELKTIAYVVKKKKGKTKKKNPQKFVLAQSDEYLGVRAGLFPVIYQGKNIIVTKTTLFYDRVGNFSDAKTTYGFKKKSDGKHHIAPKLKSGDKNFYKGMNTVFDDCPELINLFKSSNWNRKKTSYVKMAKFYNTKCGN